VPAFPTHVRDQRTSASTLSELLGEIKNGFVVDAPVFIQVEQGAYERNEVTIERTMTVDAPLDWAGKYTRDYGHEPYTFVGPNSRTSSQPVTIGRSRSCDVCIDSESVSKLHAQVICDRLGGHYYLVDESSRNGTCINGQPLTAGVRMTIWSGAYVSFGDAIFVFIDPAMLRKLSKLAG